MKIAIIDHIRTALYEIILFLEKVFTKYGLCKIIVFSIGTVHCLYASVFLATGFKLMFAVNMGSIAWYSYAFHLARQNKTKQAFMLSILEVYMHAVLASSLFGGSSLFILPIFGIYMLQFIVFKNIFINLCILILSVIALIVSFLHGPTVDVSNDIMYFFIVMNSIIVSVFICFFGIIFSFQGDNIEEIRKKYYIDWLTNLNNRKYVEEKMFKELESLDSCTVCICDIDNFKVINDTYGHDIGDIVLKEIASILRAQAKSFGCEIARWGGEEFIFKLDNTNRIITQSFFDSTRKIIETKYIPEINGSITTTFGVCYVKKPDTYSVSNYFKLADELLYFGKKNGKNQVVIKEYKAK